MFKKAHIDHFVNAQQIILTSFSDEKTAESPTKLTQHLPPHLKYFAAKMKVRITELAAKSSFKIRNL